MATAKLTVPILLELKDIEAYMAQHDIVEVVRCKDCKWYKTNYSWNGAEHKVCVIEPYEPIRKECDYCSRGERKETEDECRKNN